MVFAVEPARRHHPAVLIGEVAFLGRRQRMHVPRVAPVDRIAQRILRNEDLLGFPIVVERMAEQDPDAQIDLHQIVGHQFPVDHDARRNEHLAAPVGHVLVLEVAVIGILEGSPAAEQDAAFAVVLVARQRIVPEVEQVVVQRHADLHVLDVAHQARIVIGEELLRRDRPGTAGVERRRMHVPPFHEAKHLARIAADLQRLAVEVARERIERRHDVGDGLVAVNPGVGRFGFLRLLPYARIRLADHLLAVVDADEILLEDVVIEHVLGGFAEVHDPFTHRRRTHAERHVLRVHRTDAVIVPANSADSRRDEMRVARIFAFHENAVAAEDRRRRVTFGDDFLLEVDLRVNAETADDPRDGIPRHIDQTRGSRFDPGSGKVFNCHIGPLVLDERSLFDVAGGELFALMTPLRFFVERVHRKVTHGLDDRTVRGADRR